MNRRSWNLRHIQSVSAYNPLSVFEPLLTLIVLSPSLFPLYYGQQAAVQFIDLQTNQSLHRFMTTKLFLLAAPLQERPNFVQNYIYN